MWKTELTNFYALIISSTRNVLSSLTPVIESHSNAALLLIAATIKDRELGLSSLLSAMGDSRSWETFHGLNQLLEDPRCSVSRACQAVEECCALNRCAIFSVSLSSATLA